MTQGQGGERLVKVQDALNKVHVRVHERMDGDPHMTPAPNNLVTRMLVCHTQAGSIIGK